MRRLVVLGMVIAATACGGVQVPQHNGYKSATAKPWKKPRPLKLSDKLEAKADGDLSYPDMRRAVWYELATPSVGTLEVRVEVTPPGDTANDDFDLGMEIYNPDYKMLVRSDLDDADAHELTKKQTVVELPAAKYLIHLYLQGRLDTADYSLHATFKPTTPSAQKSDFPAQVQFVSTLPMVPIDDDTPKTFHPPPPPVVVHVGHRPPPPPPPDKPVAVALTARIIGISVVGKGTQITIGRGTATGAAQSMHGRIAGVPGQFNLDSCSDRTCVAVVAATPDQLKSAASSL